MLGHLSRMSAGGRANLLRILRVGDRVSSFWGSPGDPRCHGTRLQMHALSNLAPAVPLTRNK